ncbi:MAG: hypothetical protein Kow0089_13930 [Desulfobulbaceae bacterium]
MSRIAIAHSRCLPAFLLVILACCLQIIPARTAFGADELSLRTTVEVLSGLSDRRTGTPGCAKAAAYIRERLAGANPDVLDSQRFTLPVLETEEASLQVGDRKIPLRPLLYNAITPESLPPEGLEGRLVYAGRGEPADFNGSEIVGAIVLLEFDSGRNWLNAASLGAAALIYINRGPSPRPLFQGKEELSPLQFPCFWLEAESLATLGIGLPEDPASLTGRKARLHGSARWREATAENIYALFPGTDPDLREQLIVVEAFYDSSSFIPGRAPGADEALSIAALLDLGDRLAMQPPKRTFLLVATSGHGQSLAGMRELIWAVNSRSKDLRKMEKQLKADAKERSADIELLEQFQSTTFDDSRTTDLLKALDHSLKRRIDALSAELMRLRMRQAADESAEVIRDLAERRFTLRRLAWKTTLQDLDDRERSLLAELAEEAVAEHRAVRKEVKEQQKLLRSAKRFRSLTTQYELRSVISLHLSSHGTGLGAFHQGFLYPLRPTINRTGAYRDIEQVLQDAVSAGVAESVPFVSTLRPNRLQPWEDLLPDRPALGGEVSSLAGLPGLTLATISDIRPHWSTPYDTVDRVNWDFAARQWDLARLLIEGLDKAATLEPGSIRNGFSNVTGRSSLLLHGELFAEHPAPGTVILAFQGLSRYHVMTDRQGRFLLKGVADKKHVLDKVILEGYRFSDLDGSVVWAIDKKLTGKSAYRVKMQRTSMETDLVMFACRQTTIFNLLEPRSFRYMTKLELIDGRREAPPVRYWYSRIDTRTSTIASIFLEPDTPLKLTLSDTVLKKKMIMTNGSEDQPAGLGYDISRLPSLYHTTYRTARDMWTLLRPRIANLEEHNIRDNRIHTMQKKGEEALAMAARALEEKRYDVFLDESARSWALASRVYDHVETTQKDVLFGVLFYIALFVPFAFCLERLLFGFVSIYKRIAGFTLILLALIAVIAQVHPAFELAYSPTVVILAFFIIGLSFLVTMIIFIRFEDEMILLQRRATHKRPAEISRWKAFTAAFFLGVSNLRRRRIRTALTCLTLVILTFTIMSFTSVKSLRRQSRLQFAPTAPYQGLLLKNIGWNDLPPDSLPVFRSLFHGNTLVAPRVWLEADERTRPLCVEVCPLDEKPIIIQGFTGLSPDEPAITGLDAILESGRWFRPDERLAVLIPSRIARLIGYDPADPNRSFLTLWGLRLAITGVFSEAKLEQRRDLDNEILTPATFPSETVMEISEVEKEALESGEDVRSFQGNYRHIRPEQVLIMPAATLLELGGRLKAVALKTGDGAQGSGRVEELADRFGLSIFSGEPDGVFLYNASDTVSYSGMPNIIIPLLISILIVLNTMISSVYERKREIAVYTSVGLAPTHVSFLFIAEALAFAVLSVVLGYVLAQTSAGLLAETRLWQGITVNYSSTAGVAAMILVMGVVLLSVLYPSRVASSIAIPDVNRSWTMPEGTGDSLEVPLPFLLRYHENESIAGFLYSFFKGHQDISHGIFSTGPVEVVHSEPERGPPLPMAAHCVHLRAKVWLAPFDFGIMQWVDVRFCPAEEGPEFLAIHVTMHRMAGESTMWLRVNRSFVNALRKQVLVWRSLDEEAQRNFASLLPTSASTVHKETA